MGFALFRHDPYYLITITIIQLVFSLGCTSISLIFSPFNGFFYLHFWYFSFLTGLYANAASKLFVFPELTSFYL